MKDEQDSFEDWLEGFASSPYTSDQLSAFKARPDDVSASEVKRLVEEVELLRDLLKALFEYCEEVEYKIASNAEAEKNKNALFDLIRFMLSARGRAT
jgi:hypothetical protein